MRKRAGKMPDGDQSDDEGEGGEGRARSREGWNEAKKSREAKGCVGQGTGERGKWKGGRGKRERWMGEETSRWHRARQPDLLFLSLSLSLSVVHSIFCTP